MLKNLKHRISNNIRVIFNIYLKIISNNLNIGKDWFLVCQLLRQHNSVQNKIYTGSNNAYK